MPVPPEFVQRPRRRMVTCERCQEQVQLGHLTAHQNYVCAFAGGIVGGTPMAWSHHKPTSERTFIEKCCEDRHLDGSVTNPALRGAMSIQNWWASFQSQGVLWSHNKYSHPECAH